MIQGHRIVVPWFYETFLLGLFHEDWIPLCFSIDREVFAPGPLEKDGTKPSLDNYGFTENI